MPFQIILLKVHYASDILFCDSITLITIYTHREIHDVSACTHYVYMYGRPNSGRKNSIFASIDFDEIFKVIHYNECPNILQRCPLSRSRCFCTVKS